MPGPVLSVEALRAHYLTRTGHPVLKDRMVCLVRDGHPLQSKCNLDTFLAHRHLRIAQSPTDSRFADNTLASLGRSRDVAINLPHWLPIPTLVQGSNLVAVIPRRLAQAIMRNTRGLTTVKLPFATASFDWAIYWHRRHDDNPAIGWLREQLRAAAHTLG